MLNQFVNYLKIAAILIALFLVVFLIFVYWKRKNSELERPDKVGKNFPLSEVSEQSNTIEEIKNPTPPRDAKGRFIKKVVAD